MTKDEFKHQLRQVAPNLYWDIQPMTLAKGLDEVCRRSGAPLVSISTPLERAFQLVWDHIERTGWREKSLDPREQALTALAGQIATYAARKRFLTAVFTRQVERLAENRIEEAVLQVEQGQREAIGWSSW